MIKLKTILLESDVDLMRIPFHPTYSVRPHQALRVLGIDPTKIRYEMLIGRPPSPTSKYSNQTTAIKTAIRKKNKPELGNSFWLWEPEVLWELLERAKKSWRALSKKYHPDVSGNKDVSKLMLINRAWDVVKRLFALHGYELQ